MTSRRDAVHTNSSRVNASGPVLPPTRGTQEFCLDLVDAPDAVAAYRDRFLAAWLDSAAYWHTYSHSWPREHAGVRRSVGCYAQKTHWGTWAGMLEQGGCID